MKYDVCVVVVSMSFIRIDFYKTIEDFEKNRPDTIYLVLRNIRIIEKSEVYKWLTESYDAKVVMLDEEEEAVKVYNECKRARNFITIPIL